MRAIVVGAGGLGVPIARSLAAEGVAVEIYDADAVELSNLPRQVAYGMRDLGRNKAETLAARIAERGGAATGKALRFDAAIAAAVARPDVIVDGSDDPATKFLVGDWAARAGVPYVIASAIGTTGNVFAGATQSACYRCIFETPPEQAPTCGDAGVLGPMVAVVGGFAATTALQLAQRRAVPGRLWIFDGPTALPNRALAPARRSDCPNH